MRWLVLMLVACERDPVDLDPPGGEPVDDTWTWDLPAHVLPPVVPEDNPMTVSKVALGRHLFFDLRLSDNGEQACATCHDPARAFSVDEPTSPGSTGEAGVRNAMALVNVAWNATLTWADPALVTIEQQIPVPLFGRFPVELGVADQEVAVARLLDDPVYPPLFEAAFPDTDPTMHEVTGALASFVRSLTSFDAPYDRHVEGDPTAMSDAQLRGMALFFSETAECHHCHGGPNFTTSEVHVGSVFVEKPFHNTGLYNTDGAGGYPTGNAGLFDHTGNAADMGKFRPPTLRNIAVTSPYAHDGSVETLEDALRNYVEGGRILEDGPWPGDGRQNPFKSGFVSGFRLSQQEADDLLAFLESLTDETFLDDPAHTDPWNL